MTITLYLPTILVKAWRLLNERCTDCGGEIEVYDSTHAWCRDCGRRC